MPCADTLFRSNADFPYISCNSSINLQMDGLFVRTNAIITWNVMHNQCLQNYTCASAFADVSYLMAKVEGKILYKNVLNTSQNAIIGWCWWILFHKCWYNIFHSSRCKYLTLLSLFTGKSPQCIALEEALGLQMLLQYHITVSHNLSQSQELITTDKI